MKLLILTQKVDKSDPVLGFFHRWIELLAARFELVTVICLEQGASNLPSNVRILSLGKEVGGSRSKYLSLFYRYIRQERDNYDAVFVHMNPEYVILGGFLWRIWNKKIALWYVHRQANLRLWLAEKIANVVFTAAKESFTLPSKKLLVLGHGIDLQAYPYQKSKNSFGGPKLLQVGRITPIKHGEVAIKALLLLPPESQLRFVGSPVTRQDTSYLITLQKLAAHRDVADRVEFVGSVAPGLLPSEYAEADVTLNLLPTGGVDKVVLESMAIGVPVITSNQTFRDYFGEYAELLLAPLEDAEDVARKIKYLHSFEGLDKLRLFLRRSVEERGNLEKLIENISQNVSNL